MRIACLHLVSLLILGIPLCAQQTSSPNICGGGRTVDDYVADIAKSQKKKRNKNPLPSSVCVFGWCRNTGVTNPPTGPLPGPPTVETTDNPSDAQPPPPGTSSSKQPSVTPPPAVVSSVDRSCDPERAAKDVEVGDYYYSDKNYKAALNRYKLALESWPDEPAIHFRAAKSYEALKDYDHAALEYQSVIKLLPNTTLAQEAQKAISSLPK